ncbi:MAG: aminopeptidase [Bacteroidetes bacterium]|nr:MAG: aminopeptidase [Bacteroidota bacterium]RLD70827.1 MAG: aminopeptidase [Bacteroidota bacterium]RLD91864.1 MAG: aminopeptidase [Bacteroidota bacterium]RLD94857.1 MAG: aminopeptidase [Bacteroidota bacterium]
MKKLIRYSTLVLIGVAVSVSSLNGQRKKKEKEEAPKGYEFTMLTSVPATSVKDQHRSGTCWSFAAVSFIEAELMRTGQGEHDLSEMFFVRKAYEMKAEKYVRMQGKGNFGPGGLAMDVMRIWKDDGMVPNEVYDGVTTNDSLPVHGEMDGVLNAYVDAVIKNRNRELSSAWKVGYMGILDAYLGTVPVDFTYNGEEFTPMSFGSTTELSPDQYVSIGSFTHHPFYESFLLEIPDNWLWSTIGNVPLDEMMTLLDHALENGYTVCWDADVGERSYDWKKGVALMPSTEIEDLDGLERARWDELSESEQQAMFYDFSTPKKERSINQENRQEMFDNYRTTDDHLMHITGIAKDQAGNKFYLVKNSWGTGNHIYKGYHYVSEAYMRAKTIFFMVHKEAVPDDTAQKLNLWHP